MPTLHAIAYVSSASPILADSDEIDALLVDARDFNAKCDVSGVLLHHDGNFLQYIEGPTAGVAAVYRRILQSRRHHGLIELFNGPVMERNFPQWQMGFAESPLSALQSISQASWLNQMAQLERHRQRSVGLDLLLDFWARSKNPHALTHS